MTKDEALKLALEALNDLATWNDGEVGSHMDEPYAAEVARRTITAIKEALAQPEQEPVTWGANTIRLTRKQLEQFYPPQRKPLTDEEIINEADCFDWGKDCAVRFARAIEAAHGIKE